MQLNKTKAGSGSCLKNEVKASPPGSYYRWDYCKILIIFFFGIFLYGYMMAGEPNPKITISKKNSTLPELFKEIQKQTKYAFVYNNEMMRETKRISIDVKEASLEEVLGIVFKDQPVTYSIVDKIVVVRGKKSEDEYSKDTALTRDAPFTSISGMITDESNSPITKASIIVKGSRKATATDNYGNYVLQDIPVNSTLIISCIGYETKELVIGEEQRIKTQLKTAVSNLEEIIVLAYNTTTQRAVTGSVSVVKGEQIATLPNRSIDKSLQGLVPGLLVTSGNGQPGSATGNFVLRGIATGGNAKLGETFRNPLIVMDGVPVSQDPSRPVSAINSISSPEANPMAHLNPSDVETITVLKDASAVALYGSRASNGVILITTKKGKVGKTVFNIRSQVDFATRLKGNNRPLNQQEYLELLYETYRNSKPGITDAEIFSDLFTNPNSQKPKFPSIIPIPGDTLAYPATDWEGELYRNSALSTINEVGLSGGNDRANFYINLEYTKQNGVVRNTGFDRKSLRFNYDYRASKWFKIGLNTTLSYNIQDFNNDNSFLQTMAISPINPIRLANGQNVYNYIWGLSTDNFFLSPNPALSGKLNTNRNTSYRGMSRLNAELRFLKYFTFNSIAGVDYMSNEFKRKVRPEFVVGRDVAAGVGLISEINSRTTNIISTNTFRFDKTFDKDHSISILAGHEAQIMNRKNITIELKDISENPDQDQLSGKTVTIATGNQYKQTLLSYFGQINYSFKNRYFLSSSLRTDGSSQFGKNQRFGTYWSTGLGWIVSDEDFMAGTRKFMDYMKLRGSFGPSGNSAAILDLYRFDYYRIERPQNNLAILPDYSRNPANPGIQWEQTFSWNLGLDLRLLKDRLSLTSDYYVRKTSELIAENIPLPISSGYLYYTDNIGDLRNTGIELSISMDVIRNKDFRWNLSANWARNRNKLVESYYPKQSIGGTVANEVGREYNSFYMPVWAGVNKNNGRPQWIDSVTGKPTEDYSTARYEFVGKTQPDGFGAINTLFSYQGIELSAMLYYQYGFQIYDNSFFLLNDGLYPYLNQTTDALDRWQKPGDIAKNPRRLLYGRNTTDKDNGTYTSTRYLSDGDFFRLSNIQLAYIVPKNWLRKYGFSYLKIMLQGNNLATWTKYTGQDPENANGNGQGGVIYPQQRTFSIGLNASF